MSIVGLSVALTSDLAGTLGNHLLQHIRQNCEQEDLCFALWRPSEGQNRYTALLTELVMPHEGERKLHRGVSFLPNYMERVIYLAREHNAGIAFLHSHFTPGWQEMSPEDVKAERRLAPRVLAATGMPLVGLTMGTDGALSARFWQRIDRSEFVPQWCGSVRSVGNRFCVTFKDDLAPKPPLKEALKRTRSAWGEERQALLGRLHCGVVGVGSIGALISEALVRMGVETVTLIDFDEVEVHNLDRLVHATAVDIGRPKAETSADLLRSHATADNVNIRPFRYSVTQRDGLKAALDCDILFSCVDRPWPRQVLNMVAYAHLIPVIDGGIRVGVTQSGNLRSADWRAHTAVHGRPCLECLDQFDPADVELERRGLLDDPQYIEALPDDHFIHRNENVFGFAMNAAGLMVLQFLSLVVQPSGISDNGAQLYHFVNGALEADRRYLCKQNCLFKEHFGKGDHFPYPLI